MKKLFRYVKDAFREVRRAKFPDGKATRKMLLTVLVYVGVVLFLIWGLDIFFNWVFTTILG